MTDHASKASSPDSRKRKHLSGSISTCGKASTASRVFTGFFDFPTPSFRVFGGIRRSKTAHQVRRSRDDVQNQHGIAMHELSDAESADHHSSSESSESCYSQDSSSSSSSGPSRDSAYEVDIESLPTRSYPEAFLTPEGSFAQFPEFCYCISNQTPFDVDSGYLAGDDNHRSSSKPLTLDLPAIKIFNEHDVDITNDPSTSVWIQAKPAMTISEFRSSGNTPAGYSPDVELEAASLRLWNRMRTRSENAARFRRYMETSKYD